MAKFVFETSVEVTGVFGAYAHAQGEIELSDDEIDVLIRLMRKDKTTMDYRKLSLEEEDPELYEKIDNAYHDAAYEAEGHYSINYGIEEHEGMEGLEYDVNELILYCRDHCGYRKRYADDFSSNRKKRRYCPGNKGPSLFCRGRQRNYFL